MSRYSIDLKKMMKTQYTFHDLTNWPNVLFVSSLIDYYLHEKKKEVKTESTQLN